jgi:hypothetical protein
MEKRMDVAIPSRGRAEHQPTLKALTDAGISVDLVVPQDQLGYYSRWDSDLCTVRACPAEGIADTRQWIVDHVGANAQVVMLDDDLTFYKRRMDDRTKLEEITPRELFEAFRMLKLVLEKYAHAGFACREGANRNTDHYITNTRILRVLGYNRNVLEKEKIAFGRMRVMEDFDVALRLLRAGYENTIMNWVAHNQKGSGSVGGCSSYRTMEVQAAAAYKLKELHPGFVRITEKTTKTAWGGATRTDVQISWKAAYDSSKNL